MCKNISTREHIGGASNAFEKQSDAKGISEVRKTLDRQGQLSQTHPRPDESCAPLRTRTTETEHGTGTVEIHDGTPDGAETRIRTQDRRLLEERGISHRRLQGHAENMQAHPAETEIPRLGAVYTKGKAGRIRRSTTEILGTRRLEGRRCPHNRRTDGPTHRPTEIDRGQNTTRSHPPEGQRQRRRKDPLDTDNTGDPLGTRLVLGKTPTDDIRSPAKEPTGKNPATIPDMETRRTIGRMQAHIHRQHPDSRQTENGSIVSVVPSDKADDLPGDSADTTGSQTTDDHGDVDQRPRQRKGLPTLLRDSGRPDTDSNGRTRRQKIEGPNHDQTLNSQRLEGLESLQARYIF